MRLKVKPKINTFSIILIIILILGLLLRIIGITWGLPILIHPDESTQIRRALIYGQTFNFSPEAFYWPAFLSYVYFILFGCVSVALLIFGKVSSIGQISTLFIQNEASILPYFYVTARIFSVLLDVATIYLIYKIMKNLFGEKEALFSAMIYAIIPLAVREAHFAAIDTPMIFFIMLSMYFMSRYMQDINKTRDSKDRISKKKIFSRENKFLYLAAISIGFAIACKYNAIAAFSIIFFFFVFANVKTKSQSNKTLMRHVYVIFRTIIKNIWLILLLFFMSIAVFLLLNPFSIIESKRFSADISSLYFGLITKDATNVNTVIEQPTNSILNSISTKLFFQLPFALSIGLFILGILGIIVFMKNPDAKRWAIFLSFIIVLIGVLFLRTNFTRYVLPCIPFFAIFIGYLCGQAFIPGKNTFTKIFIILTLAYALIFTISLDIAFNKDTIKASAAEINTIYKSGYSILATEYVPNGGLRVVPLNLFKLIENESYVKKKNPDYIIISSEIYNQHGLPDSKQLFYNKLRSNELGYCLEKRYSYKYLNYDLYQYFYKENLNTYVSPDIEIYVKC